MTEGHQPVPTGGRAELADGSYDQRILRSTLAFAQRAFGAAAASVATFDADTFELCFEAVSGAGDTELVGTHIPAGEGIAGMVIQTREAAIVGDLTTNQQFNRAVAVRSGYVPAVICAAPLLYDDDVLGVLEVLDPDPGRFGELEIMGVMEVLADQVATSLHVLGRLRQFRSTTPHLDPTRARLAELLDAIPDRVFQDGRGGVLEAVLRELAVSPGGAR